MASDDAEQSLFLTMGGEAKLRAVVDDFVDRVFDDLMIGFLFARAQRERVKEKEYEFAAAHLGAPVVYRGRPIDEAHARHPILGGQFLRRLQILKDTMRDHGVPPAVQAHWVAHTEALRPLITRDAGSECSHEAARERVQALAEERAARAAAAVLTGSAMDAAGGPDDR